MNRKNAFSYIMWFIYSMAVCVSLLGIAGTLSRQAGYSMAVGYGVSGLWLVLCSLIVFLMHKLIDNMSSAKESGRMPALVAESLIVVILFAVGIFLRIRGLSGAGEDAAYYELTKVAEGQMIPSVVHGAVYIYLQLLHFVYLIFGNKFLAGIWLQIVLQMLAGFFFYRAVRKMSGVLAAVVTLGFVMVGPVMVSESLSLSPEMLFLAIYAIALYACVSCISGSKGPVSCMVTGLLIAVVCYLDIMGITLLLMTIAGVLLKKNGEDRPLSGRFIGILICILSGGVGFVLLMFVDSLASTKELMSIIAAWWKLYCPSSFELPSALDIINANIELLLLLLIMAIGIFSYWCRFEKERQSLWTWLAVSMVILQCFGMTTAEVDGYLNLYIILAVLAGVGLASMLASEEEGEDESELRPLDNMVEHEEPKPQPVEVQKSEEPEPPKVNFLENPLPLPKKHVPKVLDYDVDLGVGQDDFDLVVDDNDDYDI